MIHLMLSKFGHVVNEVFKGLIVHGLKVKVCFTSWKD